MAQRNTLASSSRAVSTRRWIWGDKRMGYATVFTGSTKTHPWRVEIWLKNKITRIDDFRNNNDAVEWAGQRRKAYYGSMTAVQARKAYL